MISIRRRRVTTPPTEDSNSWVPGQYCLLHCRGGQRDLATHKIGRIRPAGVRSPCTRDLGRLFLGSVSGPDSNTHGCGVRDLVWGWHSADLHRWLVILSATPHHHAGPVHRVGRCGCNWLEPINQPGLVRDWRWGTRQSAKTGRESSKVSWEPTGTLTPIDVDARPNRNSRDCSYAVTQLVS